MIKAVIFDMDGLMFDTETLYNMAWTYAGQKHGYEIDAKVLDPMRGVNQETVRRLFREAFGEDFDFFEIRKSRVEYMERYISEHGLPHKPGLTELLGYLKDKGYQIALATSTSRETALEYLEMEQVRDYFEVIVCGDMVKNSKPDPEIYLKAVSQLGRSPKECVVLEDSPNGILSGYQAGCRVIMIPDCLNPGPEELKRTTAILDSLHDVIGYLESSV